MGGDLSERIRRLEEVVYSLERQEKDGSSPASPSDQRHARLGSTKRSSAPKTRFPLHVARCSKNPWLGLEYTIVNDSLVISLPQLLQDLSSQKTKQYEGIGPCRQDNVPGGVRLLSWRRHSQWNLRDHCRRQSRIITVYFTAQQARYAGAS